MAGSTVLTPELLALAGITSGGLYDMLVGKTAAQARPQLETILQLVPAAVSIQRRGVFDYSVDGQSIKVDFSQLETALRMVQRLASTGGGPVSIRVRFAS